MATVSYDFTTDAVNTTNTTDGDTNITGFEFNTNTNPALAWEAEILSDANFEGSRKCEVRDPGAVGDVVTIMHEIDTIGDPGTGVEVEVLCQFRVPTLASAGQFFPIVMFDNGKDLSDFYGLNSDGDETDWRITYYNGQTPWTHSSLVTKTGFAAGDYVWARMRRDTSNQWYLKLWEGDFSNEPGSDDLSAVTWADSDTIAQGYAGFGGQENSASPYEFGWFSIGTGGDAAPGPSVGGASVDQWRTTQDLGKSVGPQKSQRVGGAID